jgi:hypothetical protein
MGLTVSPLTARAAGWRLTAVPPRRHDAAMLRSSFLFIVGALVAAALLAPAGASASPLSSYRWSEVTDAAPWSARAGLQVVEIGGRFYLMGGRTPRPLRNPPVPGDSDITSDVWRSDDRGRTWKRIVPTGRPDVWPARAYFQAVVKDRWMYVIGGQNYKVQPTPCPPGIPGCPPFVSTSDFFNDVWRSSDGRRWTRMTAKAPWEGRAGLSAAVVGKYLYVLGGSRNDDQAVIGGPPTRIYYNDVWRSRDGRTWKRMTAAAPWAPRAGGVAASKDGWLWMLGGEKGFTCSPLPGCDPPYFNDVWRSRDGRSWQRVTAAAGWSKRPGHQCVVVRDRFVCFGGFGLLANPTDAWSSRDGRRWSKLPGPPWNVTDPAQVKYDFDAIAARDGRRGTAIFTFGGDRETFDFTDPENPKRVDRDVWRFAAPR